MDKVNEEERWSNDDDNESCCRLLLLDAAARHREESIRSDVAMIIYNIINNKQSVVGLYSIPANYIMMH